MADQFCAVDGCFEVAIGVSRWDREKRPVSTHCRGHYLTDVLTETVRCEVVGPMRISDCRIMQGVARGGVVEVDPLETNVLQLVAAGHVKVLPKQSAKTAPAAEAKKG